MLRQRFGIKSAQWGKVKEKNRYFVAMRNLRVSDDGSTSAEKIFFLPVAIPPRRSELARRQGRIGPPVDLQYLERWKSPCAC
jgi:hypothetical protein